MKEKVEDNTKILNYSSYIEGNFCPPFLKSQEWATYVY